MKTKDNLKEKIKIYENDSFITYLYKLDNGSSYRECEPKWVQTDFGKSIIQTPEEHIKKHLNELSDRR